MNDTPEHRFTPEGFIAILTDYYEFLRRHYIPNDAIKYPPKEGWPQLAPERLSFMGKNETVLRTLQTMPYIKEREHCYTYEIYPGAAMVDYSADPFQKDCVERRLEQGGNGTGNDWYWDWVTGFEDTCKFGPDVFWLADSYRGRSGVMLLIDTTRNTITIMDLEGEITGTELSESNPPEDEEWREHETYLLPEFFDRMKERVKSCELLPRPESGGIGLDDRSWESCYQPLVQLLQQHGWGSANFDKEVCTPKMERLEEDLEHAERKERAKREQRQADH